MGIVAQHTHDHFEALLILSGRRVQHLGMIDVEADAGCMLFMPPGLPHGARLLTDNIALLFSFNLAFLHPELPANARRAWDQPSTLEAAPDLLPFAAQPHVRFGCGAELTERLRSMGSDLMMGSAAQAIGSLSYARAQLSLLLLEVVRAFERPMIDAMQLNRPAVRSEKIDHLQSFIQSNLSERISIEDAARHLAISSSCLAARIKRVTGKTFGELLNDARLLQAKEMLLYSDCRVSDIAYRCGFDDHAYFSRRFRQSMGLSPLEYRRVHLAPGSAVHGRAAPEPDERRPAVRH
jgi:AraC-like DNA-binding protein